MHIEISNTELALYSHYRQYVAPDLAFMQVARLAGVNFDAFLQSVESEPVEQVEEVVVEPEQAIEEVAVEDGDN